VGNALCYKRRMHIFLLLAALALFMIFLFWQGGAQRAPGLPAPISPFERDIKAAEFHEMVLSASHQVPVMVDFYASWCGPCHAFAPVLAEMARDYNGGFLLARVDYDANTDLVRQYRVTCIPTVALFRNGEQIDGFEGGQMPHQVRYFLAKNGVTPANAG